ncbi:MAG: hypothetical protein SFY80_15840 [Verrucomicrobiota bacterium]|nr:hypothetical protein [Verrucomicrobiota bacterium]
MRLLASIIYSALVLQFAGCTHPRSKEAAFVVLEYVGEEFDPEALVFYDMKGFPYDGRSRVSLVRVLVPESLVGRLYAIDLGRAEEKEDIGFEDLQRVGATVHFSMCVADTSATEKQMIPVQTIQRAPNQTLQHNDPARHDSCGARVAPLRVVADL